MTQRIRYVKHGDKLINSTPLVNKEGLTHIVVITQEERTHAKIISSAGDEYIMDASSLHKIKIKVKDMLTKIGIEFSSEERKKRVT